MYFQVWKKTGGAVGKRVYIQKPFALMAFSEEYFQFGMLHKSNPFPESFLDSTRQYEYVAENRISKLEKLKFLRNFELCQNRAWNSIYRFFVTDILDPPILKHFLIKLTCCNFVSSCLLTFPSGVFPAISKSFFW